jgi:hypothetical protein
MGHPLMSNEPSSTIITLLRSTSLLLEHYGYSEYDPTLSDIQYLLARAVARLEAAGPSDARRVLPVRSRLQ